MSEPSLNPRVLLSHGTEATRNILFAMIEALGHEITGVASTISDMKKMCEADRPDLIISGVIFPDGDGIDALIEISDPDPLPSIIVTRVDSLERVEHAMDDHVMAYLIDPVTREDLKPTIYVVMRRFKQFEDLHKENDNLKDALATRKVVERAKGILMASDGLSEEDAYLRLRDTATSNRQKMADVAQSIIDSQED